jgi:hypothetical protein
MKFVIGLPHNPTFDPERDGWQRLREPDANTAIFVGNIFGLIMGALAYLIAATWWGFSLDAFFDEFDLWFLPLVLVVIVIHEGLHGIMHPGCGLSSHTTYGVVPRSLICYAHYDASVARSRVVVILLAPFIGLTFIPLLIATIWPSVALIAVFIAVLNASFSALDLLNAKLILSRTPFGALIRNQGCQSYWRLANA